MHWFFGGEKKTVIHGNVKSKFKEVAIHRHKIESMDLYKALDRSSEPTFIPRFRKRG